MKAVIFILALSAIAAPIYTAACTLATPATTNDCTWCSQPGTYLVGASGAVNAKCMLCAAGGYKMGNTAADAPAAADAACTTTPAMAASLNCLAGATVDSCVVCKAGYRLSTIHDAAASPATKGACTMCGSGKGKAATATPNMMEADTTCVTPTPAAGATAVANCMVYGDTTGASCVMCNTGYYMESATSCKMCNAACASCTGAEATKCAYCAKGAVYTADMTCTMCDTGKTTAAAQTSTPPKMQTKDADCMASTTGSGSSSKARIIVGAISAFAALYALF